MGADYIRGWLELLRNPYELYKNASNEMRRRLNKPSSSASSSLRADVCSPNSANPLARSWRLRSRGPLEGTRAETAEADAEPASASPDNDFNPLPEENLIHHVNG